MRAGLVDRPEDYRWNSLGYHLQTENKGQFLSTELGLDEFNPPLADKCLEGEKERIRRYRLVDSDTEHAILMIRALLDQRSLWLKITSG